MITSSPPYFFPYLAMVSVGMFIFLIYF
ncbi:hypothetical protein LINGRAPRIM_LOCUS790 [Linum grandiflorum]